MFPAAGSWFVLPGGAGGNGGGRQELPGQETAGGAILPPGWRLWPAGGAVQRSR